MNISTDYASEYAQFNRQSTLKFCGTKLANSLFCKIQLGYSPFNHLVQPKHSANFQNKLNKTKRPQIIAEAMYLYLL